MELNNKKKTSDKRTNVEMRSREIKWHRPISLFQDMKMTLGYGTDKER